jgi:hypothetical protein
VYNKYKYINNLYKQIDNIMNTIYNTQQILIDKEELIHVVIQSRTSSYGACETNF